MVRHEAVRVVVASALILLLLGGASALLSRVERSWAVRVEPLVPAGLPVVVEHPSPPVVPVPGRLVPSNVLKTASKTPAPWAPGVVLERAEVRGPWEGRRALIRDVVTRDRRSYAIGDLLPHGSLLVGISTAAVDILVADVELVRLYEGGRLRPLVDFRTAYEARPLPRARDLPTTYRRLVDDLIAQLLADDPAAVQEAINVLVESGELAVEQLIPYSGSERPVAVGMYVFGRRKAATPLRTQGEIIMHVLETVTGQAFSDARAWERWWHGN